MPITDSIVSYIIGQLVKMHDYADDPTVHEFIPQMIVCIYDHPDSYLLYASREELISFAVDDYLSKSTNWRQGRQ